MNQEIQPWLIPLVVVVLFIQAWFIFRDARKRGEKYYWFWGIFGLINAPGSLLVYLLITRVFRKKKK